MSTTFAFVPVLWNRVPTLDWDESYDPLVGRWLYVFARTESGGPSRWVAEYWVDEAGRVCPALAGDPLDPGCARPPAGPPSPANFVFLSGFRPDEQGTGWTCDWYRLVASRPRLPAASIERLRAAHRGDWALDEARCVGDRFQVPACFVPKDNSAGGAPVVRVLDALHVLMRAQAAYAAALFARLEWDVPLPPPDRTPELSPADRATIEAQRQAALGRQARGTVLELIAHVLEGAPDLRARLDHAAFMRDVRAANDARAHLDAAREREARALIEWSKGDLVRASLDVHALTEDDLARFVSDYGLAHASLAASPTGLDYLRAALDDPTHPANVYVLPSARLADPAFGAVRKAAGGVLTLYKELMATAVKLQDPTAILTRLRRINDAFGEAVVGVANVVTKLPGAPGKVVGEVSVTAPQLVPDWARLEGRLKEAGQVALARSKDWALLVEELGVAVASLNLGVAALKAANDPSVKSYAGVVGSSLSLARAFERPLTEAIVERLTPAMARQVRGELSEELAKKGLEVACKRGFRLMAGVSGSIDGFFAAQAMRDAGRLGDDSLVAGNGMILLGSVCTVMGAGWGIYLGSAAAASTLLGPLAIAGVLLVVGGTIVVVVTQDSPWQTFFTWSEWGDPSWWSSGDAQPNWSPVPLRGLRGDYPAQLQALTRLLADYALDHELPMFGDKHLTISPGLLGEGARFDLVVHVEWRAKQATLEAFWERYDLSLPWGQPARISPHRPYGIPPTGLRATYEDLDGPAPVARVRWPSATEYADKTWFVNQCVWYVRLDLGSGDALVPDRGWIEAPAGILMGTSFAAGKRVDDVPPLPE